MVRAAARGVKGLGRFLINFPREVRDMHRPLPVPPDDVPDEDLPYAMRGSWRARSHDAQRKHEEARRDLVDKL
jgi:hypothetical protein